MPQNTAHLDRSVAALGHRLVFPRNVFVISVGRRLGAGLPPAPPPRLQASGKRALRQESSVRTSGPGGHASQRRGPALGRWSRGLGRGRSLRGSTLLRPAARDTWGTAPANSALLGGRAGVRRCSAPARWSGRWGRSAAVGLLLRLLIERKSGIGPN